MLINVTNLLHLINCHTIATIFINWLLATSIVNFTINLRWITIITRSSYSNPSKHKETYNSKRTGTNYPPRISFPRVLNNESHPLVSNWNGKIVNDSRRHTTEERSRDFNDAHHDRREPPEREHLLAWTYSSTTASWQQTSRRLTAPTMLCHDGWPATVPLHGPPGISLRSSSRRLPFPVILTHVQGSGARRSCCHATSFKSRRDLLLLVAVAVGWQLDTLFLGPPQFTLLNAAWGSAKITNGARLWELSSRK